MPIQAFSADYDQVTRYLRVSLRGLWSVETVNAFTREMMAIRYRVAEAGHRDEAGRILLDLSGFLTQPPAVGNALAALLPQLASRAGRVAVIHSVSMLQKLQLRRLLPYDKVKLFTDINAGRRWLEEIAA